MKKTILFIAAGIIVFCIVPITTTQAVPLELEPKSSIVSQPTNAIVPVLEPCNIQQLRTTTIARGGSRPSGNRNPHVKRRGYGDSTMGDDYVEEDDGDEEDENDEDDWDDDEETEDLEFGDDSAVEYNSDL